MPRDVLEGLLASEDMRHTHNLQGVAGCLVDLMEVPPQLVTAVDVVAGNQLFQVHDGCCRFPGLRVLSMLQANSQHLNHLPAHQHVCCAVAVLYVVAVLSCCCARPGCC